MKKKLIEARALALKNADEILTLATTEERAMTAEEQADVKKFQDEVRNLDVQLDAVKVQEEMRAAQGIPVPVPAVHGNNPSQSKGEKKIIERYNIHTAIRSMVSNTPLTGVEKEVNDEALKEMRESGVGHLIENGGINIPSFAMREGSQTVAELRANEQVAGTDDLGGFTVGRDLVEVIGILRPQLSLVAAGARQLRGLKGNLDFTNQNVGAQTNWATEIAAAEQSHAEFAQRSMTPHRLAAWTDISLQLLAQSSIDMQQFTIGDINDAMNYAVERAAFVGTGVAPIPLGIIGEVPELGIGDNGGAYTFDHAVDVETLAHSAFSYGDKAYIVNSKTYGSLKKERTDAGSGIFTIAQDRAMLNGKKVYISDALPDNLNKGTVTDDSLSASVYGQWSDLLIGNWAGVNIVVDQTTKAKEGMITIVTNSFWDVLARRLESFVSTSDIVTA